MINNVAIKFVLFVENIILKKLFKITNNNAIKKMLKDKTVCLNLFQINKIYKMMINLQKHKIM